MYVQCTYCKIEQWKNVPANPKTQFISLDTSLIQYLGARESEVFIVIWRDAEFPAFVLVCFMYLTLKCCLHPCQSLECCKHFLVVLQTLLLLKVLECR